MKRLISIVLSLTVLLSILIVPTFATQSENMFSLTDEEIDKIFHYIGFSTWGSYWTTDDPNADPQTVPESIAFTYLYVSGQYDPYLIDENFGGNYVMTYDEYMALIDKNFTRYTNMKAYLTGAGFYDESTDMVTIFQGGYGDAVDWVVTSTYETEQSLYIMGLFLDQPFEGEGTEYFDWYYSNYGDPFFIRHPMLVKLDKTKDGYKIDMCREFEYYIIEEKSMLMQKDQDMFMPYAKIYTNIEKGAMVKMNDANFTDCISRFKYNDDNWYLYGGGFFLDVETDNTHTLDGVYVEDANGKNPLEYVEEMDQYCGFPEVGVPLTLHVETSPIITESTPDIKLEGENGVVFTAPVEETEYYENLDLIVDKITSEDKNFEVISNNIGVGYEEILPLDITLKNYKGDNVQPNGDITLTIPVPNGWDVEKTSVIYVSEDGVRTTIPVTVSDDKTHLTFVTNHFSSYVLCQESNYIYGDIDWENEVTSADALLALQFSVGKITLNDVQIKASNVDGAEGVTANDALLILQKAVNKISSFPVQK